MWPEDRDELLSMFDEISDLNYTLGVLAQTTFEGDEQIYKINSEIAALTEKYVNLLDELVHNRN